MALMTQPNLSTKNEETPKVTNATKRSSSIGIAFKRLFSKSPQHDLLQNEVVRSQSVSSPLGQTPRASAQSAGVRGRPPPKSLSVPPNPIQVQNVEYKVLGGLFPAQQSLLPYDRITRAAMAMAPSHRGGHDVSAYGGNMVATTTATTHTYHGETHTTDRASTDASAAGTTTTDYSKSKRRSDFTARVPDQQRGDTNTEVIVHYSVPAGQRYLPIALGQTVTMVHIGSHNSSHVYEPTNAFLRSTEDGLRYHRSMNEADVYEGPLDMATFGKPVCGPLSDDSTWLVNPLSYDPTRPSSAPHQAEH